MKNLRKLNLPEDLANKQPLILFDGECTLCNNTVHFLLKHNRTGNLNFTSLQSETGSELVKLAGKADNKAETVMFLQDSMLYGYSTAALKITAHLGFPWRLLGILQIVPALIRDILYRFIAKHRYRWFGRKPFCMTDKKEHHERFLY